MKADYPLGELQSDSQKTRISFLRLVIPTGKRLPLEARPYFNLNFVNKTASALVPLVLCVWFSFRYFENIIVVNLQIFSAEEEVIPFDRASFRGF